MADANAGEDVTVMYHGGGCRDGFCAAWCLRLAFPKAEFVAVNYGTPAPDVARRRVFVVDFCFPADELRRLASFNACVTVLDHHATAQAVLHETHAKVNDPDKFRFFFDAGASGARMAWNWVWHHARIDFDRFPLGVNPTLDAPPWFVDYVEDRDLWRWALPRSWEVNAALRLVPLEFEEWDFLLGADTTRLADDGRLLVLRDAEIVAQHVRHARPVRLFGHDVPVVNATVLMSEIGEALSEGQPFAATYFDDLHAGVRRYSLRSRPGGLDVGELAKLITGGGGHKHAAGFQMPLPPV